MKNLKEAPVKDESQEPIVENKPISPSVVAEEKTQEASAKKIELIVMQDFGRFKKGQIVTEATLIDQILASPQKRFTRIKKGN